MGEKDSKFFKGTTKFGKRDAGEAGVCKEA